MDMEKDQNDITYRILNLTLEIIYLLTGERFPPVKSGDHLTIMVPPPQSLKPKGDGDRKILELIKKMMELLTGEVPIRCQDVTVYFSMEEWEYLEGHKDLYKDAMMKDHHTLPDPDASVLGENLEKELTWREDEDPPEVLHYEDSTSSEEGIFTDTENDTSRDCARYSCRTIMEDSGEEGRLPPEDIPPLTVHKQTSSGQAKSELLPDQEPGPPCMDTVTPTDHTRLTSSHVKAEPSLYKDLDIDSLASADRRPYTPPHIKEEPLSDEEEPIPESDLLDPMDCSQRSSIKDESMSWDEGDFLNSGLYTHHGQYISAHIKMEAASGSNDPRKRWPCFECGKTLSTRSNLFVHQRSHVRKKPFVCVECGKGFSSRGYLVIHRRNHTGERPFSCSECGESYTAKSQLLRHQTKLHSDRRFVCADCGRCFIVRSALNEHRKIHSGEKPFSCAECGRCFNRKSNLISHYKVHTGEKPHGCPDCSKSFTTKSVLRAHQRIHMGLKFRS
ncbi:gastrula zinc finger protein XlCGF48.2-like [Lithobates pipiens]